MANIIVLMSFLFVFVIGRLKCLCAEKSNDKLFAEKKEEELMCSNSEYMREEPKDLFQVQCWETWLK